MGYPVQLNNTVIPLRFLMVVGGTDHIDPALGLTPTVTIAKNNGPFISPSGAITEVGNGWYQVAANPTDANTLGPIILHAFAPGADPVDEQYSVVSYNPTGATAPTVQASVSIPTTTYEEMVRSLRLYVPQLPYPLAQQFIRDRYRQILELRPWSGLRGEGEFILNDMKTAGTVTITRGTAVVNGSGTAFSSTDVGRQFKGGAGSPVYTILTVDVSSQALTLDRNVSLPSSSTSTYVIFDGYLTCPSDFLRFITVIDPYHAWRLRHWVTQDELMGWDPQRTFFGQPYMMVDRRFSSTTGQVQYEAWPYASSAQGLVFYYIRRLPDLINPTDVPIWPIRSDVIVTGALADVARWPGTKDNPNPYFARADMPMVYLKDYQDKLIDLERIDEEVYMTWLQGSNWTNFNLAPMSASWMQTHAV